MSGAAEEMGRKVLADHLAYAISVNFSRCGCEACAAITALIAANGWINTKDRQPETNAWYVGLWLQDRGGYTLMPGSYPIDERTTHWLELPPPPFASAEVRS